MINALLWPIIWLLVRTVLDVSKDYVVVTIEAVSEAEKITHTDGSPLSGPEKKDYVFGKLQEKFSSTDWAGKSKKVANVIIELAVNYVKGYINEL